MIWCIKQSIFPFIFCKLLYLFSGEKSSTICGSQDSWYLWRHCAPSIPSATPKQGQGGKKTDENHQTAPKICHVTEKVWRKKSAHAINKPEKYHENRKGYGDEKTDLWLRLCPILVSTLVLPVLATEQIIPQRLYCRSGCTGGWRQTGL